MPVLKFANVKLAFGGEVRLRIDELSISKGERVLLLGHNGAGKTTLLNIAAGIAHPTGSVTRCSSLHIFGHQPMLFGALTVSEHFDFWSSIFEVDRGKILEMADFWGVLKFSARTPSQLSRGEQARVALTRTFASKSELLLLDEPTTALDKAYVRKLEELLSTCGRTIIASSHAILPSIFSRIIILKNGSVFKDIKDPGVFESAISMLTTE